LDKIDRFEIGSSLKVIEQNKLGTTIKKGNLDVMRIDLSIDCGRLCPALLSYYSAVIKPFDIQCSSFPVQPDL